MKGRNPKPTEARCHAFRESPSMVEVASTGFREDIPFIRRTWHLLFAQTASDAGVQLPMNVLRHTFGSYHYALHRNENLTAAEIGNSPRQWFSVTTGLS